MVGPMEPGVYLPVCFCLSRKTREREVKSRHFLPALVLSPQHSGLGPWGARAEGPQLRSGEEVGGYNSLFCPSEKVCPARLSAKTCQVTTDTLCGKKSGGSGCRC